MQCPGFLKEVTPTYHADDYLILKFRSCIVEISSPDPAPP